MFEIEDVGVFLGLDVGKSTHHGHGLTPAGKKVFDKPLPNSEPKLRAVFDRLAAKFGTVLVIVDQPASIGALPLTVARDAGCRVAYLPGLAMRRIADLYPGEAKTDARDAAVIADAARTMPHTLRSLELTDEITAELTVLVGFDQDLAAEATRTLLEAHPLSPVLTSMPGVGVRTAAVLLVTVGDGTGFPTAAHLASYAGLAPTTRQSGTSIHGEHAPRGGNRQLKRAMFLSAFACMNADPSSRAYYDKQRARGKTHTQALLRLARQRISVLFAMLRDGTFYESRTPKDVELAA
ncbi:IS110 family transposase [Streptomyces sp. ITFR-6]|uniref:IS110 family transposase n=1 Tax=Streptomyces sp. ITFR-6 TaxID=3075197 RepID=UPI00288B180E|nr:IS110 family transposase [Streptomyces sp. ITFR-6]WNI27811.1 IS110 family transposase [Streptomyces sp. ITFR-6]